MKPSALTVSLSTWKELYAAAQQFNALQPWTLLDDADLICVRNPNNGETGYGAVMGSLGTLFGFCLYRGAHGFDFYRRQMMDNGSIQEDDFLSELDCLKVDFCSRAEMEREDISVIKKLNLSFNGKFGWPQFRSVLPRYAPWFLSESEAAFLTLGLKAACLHYHTIDEGTMDESLREDECLMYTPINTAQTEFQTQWEPLPLITKTPPLPPIFNLSILTDLKTKSLTQDTAWEADVIMLPSMVFEGERPYFVRMTALCHASTGIAFKTDVAVPDVADQQLLADTICSVIKAQSRKPDTLLVKNKKLKDALTPLGNVLGIQIKQKKNLPAVQELRESLNGYIRSGKF